MSGAGGQCPGEDHPLHCLPRVFPKFPALALDISF